MALNPNALIFPSRGTIFVAPVDTAPPTASGLATLSPSAPPTSFECLGHTSRENLPAYAKDGGDATQYGSWWTDGIATAYDPTTWSLNFNSLQSDALSLGLAFGGGVLDSTVGFFDIGDIAPVSKALLLLLVDGSKRRGFYHPNASITLGDAPEIATDAFFEIPMTAQLLKSPSTTAAWAGKFWRIIDPALVAA